MDWGYILLIGLEHFKLEVCDTFIPPEPTTLSIHNWFKLRDHAGA